MITEAKTDVLNLMKQTGAILEGHFELSSGVHTQIYFQCAKLLQYPEIAEYAGAELAAKINYEVDTIISPAVGGIVIGYVVARSLGKRTIFVERKDGRLQLRRGFNIEPDEKLIIIEDVITTAKSALETAAIVEEFGGIVKGYGCIVDRSKGKSGLDIRSLLQVDPVVYDPNDCPLCKQGIPIEKPGSKAVVKKDY